MLEDWLDGVTDSALRGDGHDLRHSVGEVHLKHVLVEML